MKRTFIDAAMDIAEDDQPTFVVMCREKVWVELLNLCDYWQGSVMSVHSGFLDGVNMLGLRSEKPIPD
jgi:hypothetical protein